MTTTEMAELLQDIAEVLENYRTVELNDCGFMSANDAMAMYLRVQEALKDLENVDD